MCAISAGDWRAFVFFQRETVTIESWFALSRVRKSVLDWNRFHIQCTYTIMVLRTQRYTGRVAQCLPSSTSRFGVSQLNSALKCLAVPALVLTPFALSVACG